MLIPTSQELGTCSWRHRRHTSSGVTSCDEGGPEILSRASAGYRGIKGRNVERRLRSHGGCRREGEKLCKKRMRWNCTRRITRGDTWENGTRPFLGPVSFTPGIFRASIKKPSIFKVKFHRVTSRVYEREPPSIGHETARSETIVCSPIADISISLHVAEL